MANSNESMREALAGLIDGICFHCDLSGDCKGVPCEKMQKAKAALAAPPRQCDMGTAEEQNNRFREFCEKYPFCEGCKMPGRKPLPGIGGTKCALAWAQMPYEAANESEAK